MTPVTTCPVRALPANERAALRTAVRLAWRGHGWVEPNPMVGCVVLDAAGTTAGWGFHPRFGDVHAEVAALRRAGPRARGGTAVVTLEPCDHQGKQPPCTQALVDAGVSRVVFATADPNPAAAGGGARLAERGMTIVHATGCPHVARLNAPFLHRVRTGRPWVVAKWAQTIDGHIATRTGHSQWISGGRSRRAVHRERGRVDAILTGIGTIRADDARLTARGVRLRRTACRVVVDGRLETPPDAAILADAPEVPVLIVGREGAVDAPTTAARTDALRANGAEVALVAGTAKGDVDLGAVLDLLAARACATVLVEAGPRLVGSLISEGLLGEAWVVTGPTLLGDDQALPALVGRAPRTIDDGVGARLLDLRRRGDDAWTAWSIDGET